MPPQARAGDRDQGKQAPVEGERKSPPRIEPTHEQEAVAHEIVGIESHAQFRRAAGIVIDGYGRVYERPVAIATRPQAKIGDLATDEIALVEQANPLEHLSSDQDGCSRHVVNRIGLRCIGDVTHVGINAP